MMYLWLLFWQNSPTITFVQVGSAFGSGTSAEEQRHDKVAPEERHSSCGFKRLPKVRTRLRCRVGLASVAIFEKMFGIDMNRLIYWIILMRFQIQTISSHFKNCLILLILQTNCINAEPCHVLVQGKTRRTNRANNKSETHNAQLF